MLSLPFLVLLLTLGRHAKWIRALTSFLLTFLLLLISLTCNLHLFLLRLFKVVKFHSSRCLIGRRFLMTIGRVRSMILLLRNQIVTKKLDLPCLLRIAACENFDSFCFKYVGQRVLFKFNIFELLIYCD